MSRRPGFIVDVNVPADGGEPPNQYAARISVQVRVNFPPKATREEVYGALQEAYLKAEKEVREHSWRNW